MPAPLLLVTRPEPQASQWVHQLEQMGCRAQALPLIDIQPLPQLPEQAPQPGKGSTPASPLDPAPTWRAILFVSPSAVNHCPERWLNTWFDSPSRPAPHAWTPGPGTAMALQAIQRNHPNLSWVIDSPAAQAAHFDSESLWAQVSEQIRPGDAVLILRGLDAQEPLAVDNEGSGREWLAEQIRSRQGLVHYQAVYQRTAPAALPAWALNHPPHDLIWLFSSSQAVQHLHQCAPQATWQDSRALATHPRIAQAASEMGFGHVQLVPPQITPIARLVQDTVSR